MIQSKKTKTTNALIFIILCLVGVFVLYPLFFILNNSFKGKLFISKDPFSLPTAETFAGLTNYVNGLIKTGLLSAIGWSFFITIFSVILLILFTSMTAYYLTRVKEKWTQALYYMFVFSMIVPFQMVMFTMSSLADKFHLKNPVGMCILYLGFGAGLSVFMFAGFIKSVPIDIEEAAMIDGCNPLQTFFKITVPLLKPTILLTTITSTNGTLQLFDESLNLTNGGPGKSTMTMSHYIYNTSFVQSPNFGYAAAMSIIILIMVAILALLQMKVGDER